MKIQSQTSREYKDKKNKNKKYKKCWIVISSKIMKKLGWNGNEEIEEVIENGNLILKLKKK